MKVNHAGAVPARKNNSVFGTIKSKLAKNLGHWKSSLSASPTAQDLLKREAEATAVGSDQQQCEVEENNGGDREEIGVELHQLQSIKEVALASTVDRIVSIQEHCVVQTQQKCFETPEESGQGNDGSDEDELEIQEKIVNQSDDEEEFRKNDAASLKQPSSQTLQGDDDNTREAFDQVKGERELEALPLVPENSIENDYCDDEVLGGDSNESVGFSKKVDLTIIGITPKALRNHIPCDDVCETNEDEYLDADAPTTRRSCEPLSSPLRQVHLGAGVEMMPFERGLPHPPLEKVCEESGSLPYRPVSLRGFRGRSHPLIVAQTPILSSAKDVVQVDQVPDEDRAETNTLDTGALITRTFGERVVTSLAADAWGDRQGGFDAIILAVKKANVAAVDAVARQDLLGATFAAVQCGVEDRVAPVMYCALDCLHAVLKDFARVDAKKRARADFESHSVPWLNTQLSSLVSALVKKMGDSNKRTQREITQALLRIARLRSLRALPHLLLHLSGKELPPRRQLEILRRLIQEFGLSSVAEPSLPQQQLTVDTVLAFVAPSLLVAEEKTRKVAIELLADIQTCTGSSTAWQTQLARRGTLKTEVLRLIIRRVDEVVAKREQQQAANVSLEEANGATRNQADGQMDDESAFSPAELVDVPQEDSSSSVDLLEGLLSRAQDVVGPVKWRKLSSKTWSDRKEALLDIEKGITEATLDLDDVRSADGSCVQSTFSAYSALMHRALSDNIAPVANTALDTYATLIKVYGPQIEWRDPNVRDVTLLTLVRMLAAMQKANNRTTRAACRGVLKLARLPNARHPLRYVLSCVFNGEGRSACEVQVQMHLLRLLVPEFGFQADGLGASRVLEAVCKGLVHTSASVRRAAADVALSAQRLLGREFVVARLQGIKPVTLKELEKSFVDGVESDRPQTVHTTGVDVSTNAVTRDLEIATMTVGGLGEFASRRLLHSAPVSIGQLQCTPLDEEALANLSARVSNMSNEDESLMDSILGRDDYNI